MSDHALTTRSRLCRAVIYGLPVLAAAITLSAFYASRQSANFTIQSLLAVSLLANAALATLGSASAAVFLGGGQKMRLSGSVAYAIMALLLYFVLTITGIQILGR